MNALSNDAALIAAWERFSVNRLAICDLSDDAPDRDEQEERLWNAIGLDEAFIGKAIANTPAGAEVQLWCILSHEADAHSEPYALRRDLAHFDVHGSKLDWCPKLALQAIRSLRSMSATNGSAPDTDWEASMQTFLAARIAEVAYDDAIFIPASDRYEATGERIPDDVIVKTEALTEARCTAEKALIFTPTNVVANVKWKLAYSRQRWEDFCDFPDDWWEAIHADLGRIAARGVA